MSPGGMTNFFIFLLIFSKQGKGSAGTLFKNALCISIFIYIDKPYAKCQHFFFGWWHFATTENGTIWKPNLLKIGVKKHKKKVVIVQKNCSNKVNIRVYNIAILDEIDRLECGNFFKSKNELLCKALELGLSELSEKLLNKNTKKSTSESSNIQATEQILQKVNAISLKLDEILIDGKVTSILSTIVYNILAIQNSTIVDTEQSMLEILPQNLKQFKEKALKTLNMQRNKRS